jgi:hypothetical protein
MTIHCPSPYKLPSAPVTGLVNQLRGPESQPVYSRNSSVLRFFSFRHCRGAGRGHLSPQGIHKKEGPQGRSRSTALNSKKT